MHPRRLGVRDARFRRAELGPLHEGAGRVRRDGRRDRAGDRRHARCSSRSRPRSRSRSATLVAIYVSEFAPPAVAAQVQALARRPERLPVDRDRDLRLRAAREDAMPILGFGHHQSAWAGGFALSIIMLPLVSRTTMEVLALVPNHLREASYALGVSKWRTVLSVVLPTRARRHRHRHDARGRARRRRDGAAPLHVLDLRRRPSAPTRRTPVASIPVIIFEYSESPDKNLNAQAWAAAFVLIMFVLVTSLLARLMLDRSRRKLGQGTELRLARQRGSFTTPSPARHTLAAHALGTRGWKPVARHMGNPRTRREHDEEEGTRPSRDRGRSRCSPVGGAGAKAQRHARPRSRAPAARSSRRSSRRGRRHSGARSTTRSSTARSAPAAASRRSRTAPSTSAPPTRR